MPKKEWFSIDVECIKVNSSCTMELGEKQTIAKVKSMGLACHVVCAMEKVYTNKYFKITIN